MDGVPGVTQCPISPGATFVYKWVAKGLDGGYDGLKYI